MDVKNKDKEEYKKLMLELNKTTLPMILVQLSIKIPAYLIKPTTDNFEDLLTVVILVLQKMTLIKKYGEKISRNQLMEFTQDMMWTVNFMKMKENKDSN